MVTYNFRFVCIEDFTELAYYLGNLETKLEQMQKRINKLESERKSK